MSKYNRVLSIDGGGIRGIIPAQVAVSIESKLQQKSGNPDARIADYFDLIAGTSAGGILTCIYLFPDPKNPSRPRWSALDAVNFSINSGRDVFKSSFWQKVRSIDGLIDEKYPSPPLEEFFRKNFSDCQLSQLLKPCLISSYDVERRKANFFNQMDAKEHPEADYFIRDVARATSAAPTYFEIPKIYSLTNECYALIDGGVFANNPALCAYAEVRNKFTFSDDRPERGPTAKDMVILSLGTGEAQKKYPYEEVKNWGQIEWVEPLINIMMTGVAETVNYQLLQIYDAIERPNQYLRITPDLNHEPPLRIDDASEEKILDLVRIGKEQAEKHNEDLDKFIDLLLAE
ncbi:patatin-like phospholipase family protein [Tychonema sp. LEGE 07199]|uniref:patatin-like phospholipase family protein n=1 Tax=unclassified Tychonema TaxID=2642144 RepID=UPI0018812CA3|nr:MULTISPECIES: patatin-like phospholipase family protein [unclassified Tychonema]MBE9120405.1 patatin-like phospholipase family protein [Tychonema sp. LEGE 07199]MBE9131698.1 patatin-like phospholipase family protein [Tychonema sp. LEGE 07196]